MTKVGCVAVVLMVLMSGVSLAKEKMPNYLKDAKVGEWALYTLVGGMTQKMTVTKVGKDTVTIRTDTLKGDLVISTQEAPVPMDSEAAAKKKGMPVPKPTIAAVKATVKGKSVTCQQMTLKVMGQEMITTMSNAIPVMGIIKANMGGMVTMELKDYGSK